MNKDVINQLIQDYYLDLSTLTVFSKTEHQIHRKEYETIHKFHLTPAQFGVLETLYNKGELCIQQLIDKNLSSSGNMTVVIRNMERDGWIIKTPSPTDRRVSLISLTEKGRDWIEQILPEHYENVHSIFSVLDRDEKETLKQLLKKLSFAQANDKKEITEGDKKHE